MVNGGDNLTLEVCDEVASEAATEEDIARALDKQPRDEDWFLTLTRPNGEFMDVTLGAGGQPEVQVEEGGDLLQTASSVDEAMLRQLLLSFLHGDNAWRDLCVWIEPAPPPTPSQSLKSVPIPAWIGVAVVLLMFVFAALGLRRWIVWLFALAIPGLVVGVILGKLREVREAAAWKEAPGRIIRSEATSVEREGKALKAAAIDYEFTIALKPVRGSRVSIGEILPGSPRVDEVLKRYPAGTSVPVFYDPANPGRSVIERELPPNFNAIWVFVAVLAALCIGAAYWMS